VSASDPQTATDDLLQGGTYARKQLFGRAAVLRWSHGSRFRMARRLVEPHAGKRLLDYGCGDGTFLAMVRDLFPHAVGAEVDPGLVADASARFAAVEGVAFVHTSALGAEPDGSFGVVIVSVPVETGPALLAKQAFRALAALRGVEGYRHRERYSAGELARMTFAGTGTAIERPVYEGAFADGAPNRWHGHKGFNWRALAARLRRDFTIRETRFSPVGALGSLLASQAWLVCSPR
jgi:SAM-dependent methyltransferase